MKTRYGYEELYVVVKDGWILYAECLYDKQTALEVADEQGHKIKSLEEWLSEIGFLK